jgi:aspartyl-tRNA(Asn)/glutamyl-tRNA(Gln) amidotransferase subunit C
MSVTLADVEHIATLARLEFSPDEMEIFTHQMNDILAYIDKLNELDTSDVEPLSHVIDLKNVSREDEVRASLPVEEALKNAPARTDSMFKVPKVIG